MVNKKVFGLMVSLLYMQNAYGAQGENAITTYLGTMATSGLNMFSSGMTSMVTTVGNNTIPSWAISKLGYPSTNPVHKAELDKFIVVQQRHQQEIAEHKFNSETFATDIRLLDRRQGFIQTGIIEIIANRQSTDFAVFLLTYYSGVMSVNQFSFLTALLQSKQQSSAQQALELNAQLNSIALSTGSQLVGSGLQRSNAPAQQNPERSQAEDFTGEEKEEKQDENK